MINDSAVVGGADREPKANLMMNQIERMEAVVSRLCHLRDKIQNGNIPMAAGVNAKENALAATVAAVLTEGPEMLQRQFNQMNDIIEQIEQELF